MTKGISLNIGLNYVDPNHYGGWDGELAACEYDANDMEEIAKSSGYAVTKLLTKEANVDNVKKHLADAAKNLEPGDFFLLTYSGHGGQVDDENNDEDDFLDETWCLYDRQFIDDELNVCLRDFKQGVNIFVLSDSCHSGTVTKAERLNQINGMDPFKTNVDKNGKKYRFAPDQVLNSTPMNQNKLLYDSILKDIKLKEKEVNATVLLISGCQDQEVSQDGKRNGLFTNHLLRIWENGSFKGFHKKLYTKLKNNMMKLEQHPKYFREGKTNALFEKVRPFTIP